MNASADPPGSACPAERRVHLRVRVVFSEACSRIAPPLTHPAEPLSAFGMAHMLRNHSPQLTDAEIHLLISATTQYLQGRT